MERVDWRGCIKDREAEKQLKYLKNGRDRWILVCVTFQTDDVYDH